MEWLREVIWPVEARLEDEDVYWGTRLACVEMIRSGTVRFWDMYWLPGATARAVEDAGLRATIGAAADRRRRRRAGDGSLREAAERALEEVGEARELVQPALAPHAIYTVSEPSLRWIADGIEGARASGPHPSLRDGGRGRPVASPSTAPGPPSTSTRLGLLGPSDAAGPRRLARRRRARADRRSGRHRGHQPGGQPEAGRRAGSSRTAGARRHGVQVGLGTDGAGVQQLARPVPGDEDLRASPEARGARSGRRLGPRGVGARRGATVAAARGRRLDRRRRAGGLPAPAGHAPELELGDFVAGLVYAASGSIVDTTIVNGRVLMRDGRVRGRGRGPGPRPGAGAPAWGSPPERRLVLARRADLRPVGRRRGVAVGARGEFVRRLMPAHPGRSAARRNAPSR